jgi:N-acetyl-anhydromuramyl-L-alanine amidase AmpD
MQGIRALVAAIVTFSVASCTTEATVDIDTPVLEDKFEAAARAYDVPADLLKAIAYVETRWQHVAGEDDELGRPAGAGVFGLWGDNLVRGAAAAQLTEDEVRTDKTPNINAAAARLSELAAEHGISGSDLMAWRPVLEAFAQNPDDEARAAYVVEVMGVLATGATSTAEDGQVVASITAHAEIGMPEVTTIAAGGDYAGAIFRSSPNFNSRGGWAVSTVVIHTCEGNYSNCWGLLRSASSQRSAHYVVSEGGGEVTQLVRESERAWHVSADYQCSRAGNQQCDRNGVSVNNFSVGIEHAGFASQHTWSNGLLESSAKLTCDITRRHGVVRDRNHIVGHGQLQPWNRTDPGPNWPWSHYIDRVRAHCGSSTTPTTGTIIIDSNNGNNDPTRARMDLSGTWTASSNVPGYYGSGYWYGSTTSSIAPATFWFYLPTAGTKTIDAWWTAGSDRASAAPFVSVNASGVEVGRRTVNQQTSGSQWVTLGTYNFTAGWNKVMLSRWTDSGNIVVADAVRVR